MMETKWTPGPWSVPHFAQPDVNCSCKYVLTDGFMGAVASVHCSGEGDDWQKHGDNPKFDEAVANAHLIAAAPELYEALVALIHDDYPFTGIYDERKFIEYLHVEKEIGNYYAPMLLAAIAALAKARGEQP